MDGNDTVGGPVLASGDVFEARFDNYVDPIYGPTTDFDYFQIDLSGLEGAKLTLTFAPEDLYFYRISAWFDDAANISSPWASPSEDGEVFNFINHEPHIPGGPPDTGPSVTWTVPAVGFADPVIAFQLRGGTQPQGGPLYGQADYTVTVDIDGGGGGSNRGDLTASATLVGGTLAPGGAIQVEVLIAASGDPGIVSYGAYLSRDAELDIENAIKLSPERLGLINSDSARTDRITLPADLGRGKWNMFIVADPGDTFTEPDETNNVADPIPIIIGAVGAKHKGHGYGLVSFNDTAQNWSLASAEAASLGGYLATVQSQAENNHIRDNYIAGQLPHDFSAVFIGASDAAQEGVWRWTAGPENGTAFWNGGPDGAPVSGAFANWASGEPNNSTASPEGAENYAVMGTDGKWVDVPSQRAAQATVGYVIEFVQPALGGSDVSGDRNDDVIMQNDGNGQVLIARMSDGAFAGWGAVTGPMGAGAFIAIAAGDVNPGPAGGAEVFVQQQSNGSIYYASLDSGATTWGVVSAALSEIWKLRAVADVSGDGSADAIVQNEDTGEILFADMAGGVFRGWGVVNRSLTEDWIAIGAGDVNGDGFADVVVQDVTSGDTFYADMAGGAFSAWGVVTTSLTPEWQAKAVDDVTGDGVADVIFQNLAGGDFAPGATLFADVSSGGTQWGIVAANINADWLAKGTADVDNDGVADVLFQHAADGATLYADMGPAGFSHWGVVTTSITNAWHVV